MSWTRHTQHAAAARPYQPAATLCRDQRLCWVCKVPAFGPFALAAWAFTASSEAPLNTPPHSRSGGRAHTNRHSAGAQCVRQVAPTCRRHRYCRRRPAVGSPSLQQLYIRQHGRGFVWRAVEERPHRGPGLRGNRAPAGSHTALLPAGRRTLRLTVGALPQPGAALGHCLRKAACAVRSVLRRWWEGSARALRGRPVSPSVEVNPGGQT